MFHWSIARGFILCLAPLAIITACAGAQTATAPTPPATLAGRWSGTADDNSGTGLMTWQVSLSGASLSGIVTVVEPTSRVTGQGTLSGTFDGRQIAFTLSIPTGGFGSPYESCAATVSGTATAELWLLTGTYTGTNTCSGEVTSGQLTLNRQ